ncbi:MAG: ABC transporter substrate-binding protein, partial [Pseudomonadota bacterium]
MISWYRIGPWRSLIAAMFLLLAAWPAYAQDQGAIDFANSVSRDVVAILEDPDNSQDEKLVAISELLDANVDFDLVGKMVLGPHWRSATDEQRKEYLSLFRAHVLANISKQLSYYSGQEFEIVGSDELSERDTMVKTRVVGPSGNTYRVDWRVRHEGDD